MVTPRRLIVAVTAISLVAAFAINAVWFAQSAGTGRFEPVVGSLGVLAGITGVVAERWASAREARDASQAAIGDELRANAHLLATAFGQNSDATLRRRVYPRLYLSAVDAAFSSGSLGSSRDEVLVRELHDWRNQVVRFNSQLAVAEILAFTTTDAKVLQDLHSGMHRVDGRIAQMQAAIGTLLQTLDPGAASVQAGGGAAVATISTE